MILPSEATPHRWSPHHRRLHRHLLRQPELLPQESTLLLALSGGQDSMALTALLADLRRLHGWRLQLWHGDHGWRPDSAMQADALAAWAAAEGLELQLERANPAPPGEAAARAWRYARLEQAARALGCGRVVTAHTASDRAETVLINLARGSHRRGLCSLRAQRVLETGTIVVRPLLAFSRADTAAICRNLGLPVWVDASNGEARFGRNRVRAEVLPVLEALHPGASRRIAVQAERLEQESDAGEELLGLALAGLRSPADRSGLSLERRPLGRLAPANRRLVLQHWLRLQGRPALAGAELESLSRRLEPERGPGELHLAAGWRLSWDRSTLSLLKPLDSRHGNG